MLKCTIYSVCYYVRLSFILCNIKVWVLTVDNEDVKGYTRTEAICEFTPS